MTAFAVPRSFFDGRALMHHGDSRDVLKTLADSSIDSFVTDPPYALVSIVKRFGKAGAAAAQGDQAGGAYSRASAGFMGQEWDTGETAFAVSFWAEVFRVLKPGGHVVAFSGTRTYHRLAVAIEDAGFEIRDQLGWLYGTGFPKSHNVSKGIDKAAGATREVVGLSPRKVGRSTVESNFQGTSTFGETAEGREASKLDTAAATDAAKQWDGWGTALKPAWEPIVLARKPMIGTVAVNVLAFGTGAINIDACRVPMSAEDAATIEAMTGFGRTGYSTANGVALSGSVDGTLNHKDRDSSAHKLGRFPANVLHDGSDEVEAAFAAFGERPGFASGGRRDGLSTERGSMAGDLGNGGEVERFGDTGSASRFFYSAKASKADRAGSKHPTVKPVAVMRWLARLVTPPGGTIVEPFAGSGSTLAAAIEEGFNVIGIERERQFFEDCCTRLAAHSGGPPPVEAVKLARQTKPEPSLILPPPPSALMLPAKFSHPSLFGPH